MAAVIVCTFLSLWFWNHWDDHYILAIEMKPVAPESSRSMLQPSPAIEALHSSCWNMLQERMDSWLVFEKWVANRWISFTRSMDLLHSKFNINVSHDKNPSLSLNLFTLRSCPWRPGGPAKGPIRIAAPWWTPLSNLAMPALAWSEVRQVAL